MLKIRFAIVFTILTSLVTLAAAAKQAPHEILGIRLGMNKAVAHERLAKIGSLHHEERKSQEIWSIRDRRYRSIMIGYDKDGGVRYVTAVARPDGRRVRYCDVVNTKAARHEVAGQSQTYTWAVSPEAAAAYEVIAIGRHPKYLTYFSLKRAD